MTDKNSTFIGNVGSRVLGPLTQRMYMGFPARITGISSAPNPSPAQFYPSYPDMNAKQYYLHTSSLSREEFNRQRTEGKNEHTGMSIFSTGRRVPVSTHVNYVSPMSGDMYLNKLKSLAVGKSSYNPTEAPVSYKAVNPSVVQSSLRRVRSSGSVAPKKKGFVHR
jgi:hypothetical protein